MRGNCKVGEEKRRGEEMVDAIVAFVEGSMGLEELLNCRTGIRAALHPSNYSQIEYILC